MVEERLTQLFVRHSDEATKAGRGVRSRLLLVRCAVPRPLPVARAGELPSLWRRGFCSFRGRRVSATARKPSIGPSTSEGRTPRSRQPGPRQPGPALLWISLATVRAPALPDCPRVLQREVSSNARRRGELSERHQASRTPPVATSDTGRSSGADPGRPDRHIEDPVAAPSAAWDDRPSRNRSPSTPACHVNRAHHIPGCPHRFPLGGQTAALQLVPYAGRPYAMFRCTTCTQEPCSAS